MKLSGVTMSILGIMMAMACWLGAVSPAEVRAEPRDNCTTLTVPAARRVTSVALRVYAGDTLYFAPGTPTSSLQIWAADHFHVGATEAVEIEGSNLEVASITLPAGQTSGLFTLDVDEYLDLEVLAIGPGTTAQICHYTTG